MRASSDTWDDLIHEEMETPRKKMVCSKLPCILEAEIDLETYFSEIQYFYIIMLASFQFVFYFIISKQDFKCTPNVGQEGQCNVLARTLTLPKSLPKDIGQDHA